MTTRDAILVSVIHVAEASGEGIWILTSDDLPGFFLAGENIDTLKENIPDAIKLLYKLNYQMEVEAHLQSTEVKGEVGGPLRVELVKFSQ